MTKKNKLIIQNPTLLWDFAFIFNSTKYFLYYIHFFITPIKLFYLFLAYHTNPITLSDYILILKYYYHM